MAHKPRPRRRSRSSPSKIPRRRRPRQRPRKSRSGSNPLNHQNRNGQLQTILDEHDIHTRYASSNIHIRIPRSLHPTLGQHSPYLLSKPIIHHDGLYILLCENANQSSESMLVPHQLYDSSVVGSEVQEEDNVYAFYDRDVGYVYCYDG